MSGGDYVEAWIRELRKYEGQFARIERTFREAIDEQTTISGVIRVQNAALAWRYPGFFKDRS